MEKSNEKGFTLIELMVVVVILSTLAAMVVPRMAGRSEESKRAATRADIEANLGSALDLYELDTGFYPTTDQGLLALVQNPQSQSQETRWNGPYIKKKEFRDPWGKPYQYRSPGVLHPDYDLFSCGPDGAEGGNDDIFN